MLNSSDSFSFPSEPPHIGNWFSSYAYESPVLSSIEGLEDCSGEDKACNEEEIFCENVASDGDDKCAIEFLRSSESPTLSAELSDIRDFDSYVPETQLSVDNDDLSTPEPNKVKKLKNNGESKGFGCETTEGKAEGTFSYDTRKGAADGWLSKGLVKCNAPAKALDNSNQFTGCSDHLLLSPEPANMDEFLDSYVPETQFDETYDFRVPESNDDELNGYGGQRGLDSSPCKAEKHEICSGNEMKEKSVSHHLEGLVEFKASEGNCENLSQNSLSSDDIVLPSEPPDIKNWFSSYVYESPTLDRGDGFSLSINKESEFDVEECISACQRRENISSDGKSTAEKLEQTESYTNACSHDKQENPSSVQTQGCAGKNLVLSRDSMSKGNNRNGSAENGFISTRKIRGRKLQDENSLRKATTDKSTCDKNSRSRSVLWDSTNILQNVSSGSSHITTDKSTCDKNARSRSVLLDSTNILQNVSPGALQITAGKWQCPQKRKPNLGPPLKQLRLERWIRKV